MFKVYNFTIIYKRYAQRIILNVIRFTTYKIKPTYYDDEFVNILFARMKQFKTSHQKKKTM